MAATAKHLGRLQIYVIGDVMLTQLAEALRLVGEIAQVRSDSDGTSFRLDVPGRSQTKQRRLLCLNSAVIQPGVSWLYPGAARVCPRSEIWPSRGEDNKAGAECRRSMAFFRASRPRSNGRRPAGSTVAMDIKPRRLVLMVSPKAARSTWECRELLQIR